MLWKRFKSDMSINQVQAILLSRDIIDEDNDLPTKEVFKIFEAMKQINQLKAPGSDGIQAILYQKMDYYR